MSNAIPGPPSEEVEFEERRGIRRVELRRGLIRVHVHKVPEPYTEQRIHLLGKLRLADLSIDFLKLTREGLAFIAKQSDEGVVRATLDELSVPYSIQRDRCIVEIWAVNMRDEQGLSASLVADAVESGARLDHLGDMHDRLLMVVDESIGESLADKLRGRMEHSR